MAISTEAEQSWLDIIERSCKVFSVVGYYLNYMAGLEYIVDEFIFTVGTKFPESALVTNYPSFPVKMGDKIDFVVRSYITIPALRSCGDGDDYLCLNGIALGLEEAWSARNILSHGKIHFSNHYRGTFYVRTQQFQRVSRNRYQKSEYKIGRGAIIELLERASYLRSALRTAKRILDGDDVKRQRDLMRRNNADGRKLIERLKAEGMIIWDEGFGEMVL